MNTEQNKTLNTVAPIQTKAVHNAAEENILLRARQSFAYGKYIGLNFFHYEPTSFHKIKIEIKYNIWTYCTIKGSEMQEKYNLMMSPLKVEISGHWDGFVGKDTYHQA